ncbi:MAG TPA: TAXI family TRAP transporter solute-binding subunit, partial [Polyangiaceae bacterium]|nr:TAXI family TRAP transporter solute-binding subunit [Polyangiaceae bacterium]
TESGLLTWAYDGKYDYAMSGPYANLRLIAKLEDPTYLLVAAKSDSSIHDLSDIAKQHLGVKMIGGDTPISKAVLDYYGITADALTSWGGTMQNAIVAGAVGSTDFDVIVSELGSPANNPESSIWPELSQKFDLRFFDLPDELLTQLASTTELGVTRVTAKWGFLRGVDHAIATVARSGEAFFARDDAPEQAAYDVAKAIDAHRDALKWYIRPYSYDSRTVWTNGDVPLHPGAARYYREAGYMGAAACTAAAKDDAATMPGAHERSGGCTIEGAAARNGALGGAVALATLIGLSRRRRRARR